MVIAIASQKGGVGKTSTAISLAAGLARKGKRVLLIDIDSQANSSKVLIPNYQTVNKNDTICITILERKPLPIQATRVPNLDIVPSHILLSNTDIELTNAWTTGRHGSKTSLRQLQAITSLSLSTVPRRSHG